MKLSLFVNAFVMLVVNITIALFFWAIRADAQTIVTNITAVLPVEVLMLMGLDLTGKARDRIRLRKINKMKPDVKEAWLKEHFDDRTLKDRLSISYYFGVLFVVLAAGTWYLASMQGTWLEASRVLRFTLFFSVLGFFWMFWIYKPSVQTPKEQMVEDWEEGKRKLAKARTYEDCLRVLGYYLRADLDNDSITGTIDDARPLARYKGKNYTYVELARMEKKKHVASGEIRALMSAVEPKLRSYAEQKGLSKETPCAQENVELA